METLKSLLEKIHSGVMGMDAAVDYAVENIVPVEIFYSEDGVYTKVYDPDNTIRFIEPFPVSMKDDNADYDDYTYAEYKEFITRYTQARKALGKTEMR